MTHERQINVRLPKEMLKQIDLRAVQQEISRGEAIRFLLGVALALQGEFKGEFKHFFVVSESQARKQKMADGREVLAFAPGEAERLGLVW